MKKIFLFLILFFVALFFKSIYIPESLKINYKESLEYCKTLNIAQTGAIEACMQDYIYKKSNTDYELLVKISNYCTKNTPTEYDRWRCMDNILNRQAVLVISPSFY